MSENESQSNVRLAGWLGSLNQVLRRAGRVLPATEREFLLSNTWLLVTSLAMIVCYALNIPDASVILLVAVVHSGMTGGWKAGMASAGLTTLFSAIYLSVPNLLLRYSAPDFWRLISTAGAAFGTAAMIYLLQRRGRETVKHLASELRAARKSAGPEKTFQSLADDVPVLLWMADENGLRFYFNRQWLRFTGAAIEEHAGEGWKRHIHPDDRAWIEQRYLNAIRSCDNFRAEYRLRSAQGDYRWIEDTAVPRMSADGDLIGYLGCATDRTERKEVEKALHQLSGRLLELQDDERRRIARELHDTTAQNLAVLSMHLFALKEPAKRLDAKSQRALEEGLELAEQCSQEIRTVSYLLHPPLLDELGLVSALRSYTTGFMQRTGIQVELKIEEIGRLPGEIETTTFRIVQEALTNVHRHSGSSRAEVRVIRDPREISVIIGDRGKGIPADKLRLLGEGANLGVGVAGMRERASQFGGHLKIASSAQGTTITAVLPYRGTPS
ncbi:MAG TPA: PAS domain-containing sensor histidine kinase [Bryobacteraceae bacterium]|jgi:PAS domain S-box-containing protein|nr:PAS domain-containing sensor histidine kinase [Bryobacteraceae bacterium]